MNTEQLLKKAQVHYDEAASIVMELSSYSRLKGKPFSYEKAMWQFDAILQTILLNVAVEDGSFSLPDEQFIRKLTIYGDAMVTINEVARKHTPDWHMTWSGIASQRQAFGKELADYAVAAMNQLAEEFAAALAPIDSMVSRDYLSELRECVLKLMVSMSLADDSDVKAAQNLKSVAVADALLSDKWAKYLKNTTRPTPKTQKTRQTSPSGGEDQVNAGSDYLVNHTSHRDRYTNAVIFLEVLKKDYTTNGSGVIITRSGYALTCAHVVDGARRIMAKISNAGCEPVFIRATVHSVDKQNDLAVIKLQPGTYYHAELDLDRKEPVLGENIAIYGYPFGSRMNDNTLELSVSYCRGYVSSNQTLGGLRRTLLDITARSGNSGSPVTSLDNGKVIGIYFGGYPGDPSKPYDDKICGMTPMQYVRGLLNG